MLELDEETLDALGYQSPWDAIALRADQLRRHARGMQARETWSLDHAHRSEEQRQRAARAWRRALARLVYLLVHGTRIDTTPPPKRVLASRESARRSEERRRAENLEGFLEDQRERMRASRARARADKLGVPPPAWAERKGVTMVGEAHPNARLTWERVREMRAARAAGESARALATRFDVDVSIVHRIIAGKAWAPERDPARAGAA